MDKKAPSMRDFFFERLYELAKKDPKVVVVSADMNAAHLDRFAKELPAQYIDTGIAEASAVLVAAGLAREGMKPYAYAIAPFVTTRIHEFAKVAMGAMKLPITLVGVGAGLSYDESGPTHHNTEDIAIMSAIPGMHIFSPADGTSAAAFADITSGLNKPAYIRLDRQDLPNIYGLPGIPRPGTPNLRFADGFRVLKEGTHMIVSTGNMVHNALEAADRIGKGRVGVIDVYRPTPVGSNLANRLSGYDKIITLEEQQLRGGLGSIVLETLADAGIKKDVLRIGIPGKFTYQYGGRANIQESLGLDPKTVASRVRQFTKV